MTEETRGERDEAREILVRARELLAVPERWTQGALARDVSGGWAFPGDPAAVKWCSFGAIYREPHSPARETARLTLEQAAQLRVGVGIGTWNDRRGRTHASVLRVIDRAIASLTPDRP